jgi:hypothetical protein
MPVHYKTTGWQYVHLFLSKRARDKYCAMDKQVNNKTITKNKSTAVRSGVRSGVGIHTVCIQVIINSSKTELILLLKCKELNIASEVLF